MRDRRGRELGFFRGNGRAKRVILRKLGIKWCVSGHFNPQLFEQSNSIWYKSGSLLHKKSLQWGLKCFFCVVPSPFLASYEARSTHKLIFWGLNSVFWGVLIPIFKCCFSNTLWLIQAWNQARKNLCRNGPLKLVAIVWLRLIYFDSLSFLL